MLVLVRLSTGYIFLKAAKVRNDMLGEERDQRLMNYLILVFSQ